MMELNKRFEGKRTLFLNYVIDLPNDYYLNCDKKFPVILFLHGIGERGNDVNLVKKFGIHRYMKDLDIPFVVISPQCHENNFWDMHFADIELLLKEIEKEYRIDVNRICLIGTSLGAYGAWNFAMQRPNMFKTIVSIAGGAMLPKYASSLKHMSIYIAHGEKDRSVDISESLVIADALKKEGADVTLDIVSDCGHELCTKIFEKEELYKWIILNN